jgi:H/ACA ribonucleoprotein complex subunit 3
MKIMKCPSCGAYTLKVNCPKCGVKTATPHPAKFSWPDEFAEQRLKTKGKLK